MAWGLAEGAGTAGTAMLALAGCRLWTVLRRGTRLRRIAREVTAQHARLLAVKQSRLVVHDGYGNYELGPWIEHVDYFIGAVILREARARGLRVAHLRPGTRRWGELRRVLLATVNAAAGDGLIDEAEVISGEHYETLCRDILRAEGWAVETTPVTGDQGADLVADAGGLRTIIQCKFHSRPVGNKAVQEAHAALAFHGADRAAVVSNAAFTRAARELADASGVLLLHHSRLPELGVLLGISFETAGPRHPARQGGGSRRGEVD